MTHSVNAGITLESTGPEVTLQDRGRFGYQNIGLSPAGVADLRAYQHLETRLQQANPTVLQVLLGGLTFVTHRQCQIAVSGAVTQLLRNGQPIDVTTDQHKLVTLQVGDRVELPIQQTARYSYVGFQPALAVTPVLGSCSTHIREAIGPNNGKKLAPGTHLSFNTSASSNQSAPIPLTNKAIATATGNPAPIQDFAPQHHTIKSAPITLVRFIPSVWFTQNAAVFFPQTKSQATPQQQPKTRVNLSLFCLQTFTVTQESSAMGYRLQPEISLTHNTPPQVSAGTCLGMIQLPNNGNPIVLMHERQTIGGYPHLGSVISADIGKLAQRLPGQKIMFTPV